VRLGRYGKRYQRGTSLAEVYHNVVDFFLTVQASLGYFTDVQSTLDIPAGRLVLHPAGIFCLPEVSVPFAGCLEQNSQSFRQARLEAHNKRPVARNASRIIAGSVGFFYLEGKAISPQKLTSANVNGPTAIRARRPR
jgi:hypothetical protein